MLKVTFTGLVYILAYAQQALVVIPNEMNRSPFHGHSEHIAFISINVDDLDGYNPSLPADRPADFIFTPRQSNKRLAVYLLNGDSVLVKGSKLESGPLRYTGGPCKADQAAPTSIECLPSREKVCPTCKKHDTSFSGSQSEGSLVAAHVTLPQGSLSGGATDKTEWTFEPIKRKFAEDAQHKHHKQFMSDTAVWQTKDDDDKFQIVITPFDKNAARTLTFTFKSARAPEVMIGSLPAINMVGVFTPDHFDTEDHHFAAYYEMMLQPRPKDPPIPHKPPHPHRPSASSLGANCPPMIDFTP